MEGNTQQAIGEIGPDFRKGIRSHHIDAGVIPIKLMRGQTMKESELSEELS